MLASGGKILALGKVYHDETNLPIGPSLKGSGRPSDLPSLKGSGRPSDPLYVNEDWIIDKVNNKVSGASREWVEQNFQPVGEYVSATDFNDYKTEVEQEFKDTSAWAEKTFQPSGDYASASDIKDWALKTEVAEEFHNTSAWAEDTFQPKGNYQEAGDYVSADDFNKYKNEVSSAFSATSAWANNTFVTNNTFNTYSADIHNELEQKFYTSAFSASFSSAFNQEFNTYIQSATSEWDVKPYSAGPGIKIDEYIVSLEPSAVPFDNYYAKSATSGKNQLSDEFNKYKQWSETSAWAEQTFVPTSATEDWDVTKYTEGEGIRINGHEISISADYVDPAELEAALKPYAFTSAVSGFKNTLVKSSNGTVEISAYMENGVQVYDLSATQGGDYTQIVGENGVSAEKNEDTGEWHVGMNWDQNLISYGKFYTSPAQEYASSAAFAGYTMVDHISGDPDENDIDLDNDKIIIKKHGLYHVDVLVSVNIDANDTSLNYFTVTLKSGPNETLHQIDASYPHTEYINFSYDINTPTDDYILENTIKDLPVGAEFKIENMNVHRVLYSTGDMYGQGGATYIGGDGITIDQDTINVNIGKGLELNNQTEKKLQVKLGKGLTYGTGDEIDAIVLDDPTEEVVKTVTDLKEELDNKLTTNMNISDAKKIGNMFKNTTYGTMGCSLFTVPLRHKLTSDTQVSFFTTQGLNQQASFPIVIGILEYNFDYWDNDRKQYRSQTNWIADTGPIFNNTPDVNGNTLGAGANKYTFKLNHVTPVVSADYMYGGKKYHNEYGPVLRSDRAYYLAVFAKHPDGLGYVLGDEGYDSPTNSDPYISYYCNNMVYNDGDPSTSGTMDNNWTHWNIDLSISAMNYWNRGGEAKEIVRPFVMIRNPMA